jgi:hypothetical protein
LQHPHPLDGPDVERDRVEEHEGADVAVEREKLRDAEAA